MNYKAIFISRKSREAVLNVLSWVPDRLMIQLQYYIKLGRRLNLKNPKRFTEKLQWYKLYWRDSVMIQCVDKYNVREYVKSKGLEHILNECYGVHESVDDIDFDALPDKFVLKDTLGGGGNSIIICEDKSCFDIETAKIQMREWLSINRHVPSGGREWPYYNGKNSRIIVEKYIESDTNKGGLVDWKFFCFNGRAAYMYVVADRKIGQNAGIGIYDANYVRLPYKRADESPLLRDIPRPSKFDEMKGIAELLAEPFLHARVDLYYNEGNIFFGEITFFDGSGYMTYEPDEFDFVLGESFSLVKLGEEGWTS